MGNFWGIDPAEFPHFRPTGEVWPACGRLQLDLKSGALEARCAAGLTSAPGNPHVLILGRLHKDGCAHVERNSEVYQRGNGRLLDTPLKPRDVGAINFRPVGKLFLREARIVPMAAQHSAKNFTDVGSRIRHRPNVIRCSLLDHGLQATRPTS